MTAFIALGILMTLAAIGAVVVPLLLSRTGQAPIAATLTAVVAPAAAILLYLAASNHDWNAPPEPAAVAPPASLVESIARLEERLAANPDDLEGWLLLGNSYVQLQSPEEAGRAFARARALAGDDPRAKLGVAEALILERREALAGEAGRLLDEVLAVEPDNGKALFYGGLAALAGDRPGLGIERWERLLALGPPEPVRRVVEAQLEAMGVAPPGPAAPAGDGAGVDVRVSIDAALASRVAPGAVLFLVARDASTAQGPPVAVVREPARGLPRTLRIGDANAMIPGRSLTQLDEVRLIARVSNSGTALAETGDVYGEGTWRPDGGEAGVTITMDRIVEP